MLIEILGEKSALKWLDLVSYSQSKKRKRQHHYISIRLLTIFIEKMVKNFGTDRESFDKIANQDFSYFRLEK